MDAVDQIAEEKRLRARAAEKRYRTKHRETYLARRARFRERNRERLREDGREYREANIEIIRDRSAKKSPEEKARNYRRQYVYYMLQRARIRAAQRGLEFSLTPADIVIPERCPVFDIPLAVAAGKRGPRRSSPSLDRVDNSRGYVPGNVCVISHRANLLKKDATVEELLALVEYMRSYLDNPRKIVH